MLSPVQYICCALILPMSTSMFPVYPLPRFALWGCRRYLARNISCITPPQTRCYGVIGTSSATNQYDNFSKPAILATTHPKPKPRNVPIHTMPLGHPAAVANLEKFVLPDFVKGTPLDVELGQQMINAWRKDGIF